MDRATYDAALACLCKMSDLIDFAIAECERYEKEEILGHRQQ